MCLYIALGKVLSPQYIVWIIPLVPLVGGRLGVLAGLLAAAAYILTAAYFPRRYPALVNDVDPILALTVFLRNLSVLAIAAVLVLPLSRIWQRIQALAESVA